MPRDVTDFFEQYRQAFNRLDGDAIADLYCVPSGIVSDRGLIGGSPASRLLKT